jgi:uncharacterized protein YdiU (UPF0061 family)
MEQTKSDYTNTFLVLSGELPEIYIPIDDAFKLWKIDWENHIQSTNQKATYLQLMGANNPLVIPRNQLVEKALDQACNQQNYDLLHQIITAIKSPKSIINLIEFQVVQADPDAYKTFCGT